MAAHTGYNKNSSAVKRIMQEARELANDPCTDYSAAPLEDDIFEWHCTIRGSAGTEFEGGLYHFRILLPSEYPFRPPSIMMLTPSGRFELNTKICISFTSYHEELWQPAWGVRTAIIGLQGFFPLKGTAAAGVGALEYPAAERKRLATLSRTWTCPHCKTPNLECLPDPPLSSSSSDSSITSSPSEGTTIDTSGPLPAHEVFKIDTQPAEPERAAPARPVPLLAPTPTRPVAPISLVTPQTHDSPVFIGPSTPVDETADETPRTAVATTSTAEAAQPQPATQNRPPIIIRRSTPRPPIILDTAICVLLVLVFALICRRVL